MEIKKIAEEQVKDIFENLVGGRFVRVSYTSEPKVKASYKKMGVKVIKITDTTVQNGVDYDNIKRVQEAKARGELSGPCYAHNDAVVEDRLYHNQNTNNNLIRVAYVKNSNSRVKYLVMDENGVESLVDRENPMVEEYLLPSALKSSNSEDRTVFYIKAQNFIKIGEVGESII